MMKEMEQAQKDLDARYQQYQENIRLQLKPPFVLGSDLETHRYAPKNTGYEWPTMSELVGITVFFIFMMVVLVLAG